MATGKNTPAPTTKMSIHQLKVSLLESDPVIWRRLLVPSDLSLARLHKVLQAAMGWEDMHLHEFRTDQRRFGLPETADPFMEIPTVEDERKVRLSAVLLKAGATMTYLYDFGDDWVHEVLFEQQLLADPDIIYPVCIDGQRACPPEDCGGIPGYYDLLKVLAKPSHRRHKELRDWLGGGFLPETFSLEDINRRLATRKRSGKPL